MGTRKDPRPHRDPFPREGRHRPDASVRPFGDEFDGGGAQLDEVAQDVLREPRAERLRVHAEGNCAENATGAVFVHLRRELELVPMPDRGGDF